jgi:hypothetical protein
MRLDLAPMTVEAEVEEGEVVGSAPIKRRPKITIDSSTIKPNSLRP